LTVKNYDKTRKPTRQKGQEWCIHQASKFNIGIVWPWSLTFWLPKSIVSCHCPIDHLYWCAAKSVHLFSIYLIHKFRNDKQVNGQGENITPASSLDW